MRLKKKAYNLNKKDKSNSNYDKINNVFRITFDVLFFWAAGVMITNSLYQLWDGNFLFILIALPTMFAALMLAIYTIIKEAVAHYKVYKRKEQKKNDDKR